MSRAPVGGSGFGWALAWALLVPTLAFTKTTGQHGELMPDHFEAALEWLWDDAVEL